MTGWTIDLAVTELLAREASRRGGGRITDEWNGLDLPTAWGDHDLTTLKLTRGAGAARIDHINVLAHDVPAAREFMCQALGFKLREYLIPPGQPEAGAWLSLMNKAHDLAITREPASATGRLHHLAYAVESREDVLRAADVFCELGVAIEFGPAKHSRTQGFFLYVLEPGGNRVELFSGGIHIFAPDWEPVLWTTEGQGRSTASGVDVPESFHSHATPARP
jgi:catechol 2,3-dioxygenase